MPIQPNLPPDLERAIFEITAHDVRSAIPRLMLVAHRVRAWMEPIWYKVIIMHACGTPEEYPLPPFPSGPQGKHVRSLLYYHYPDVGYGLPRKTWDTHVPYYHDLQNLAIWTTQPPRNLLADLRSIVHSPLRSVSPCGLLRLSLNLMYLFPEGEFDFDHIVLRDLTHLEISGHRLARNESLINWKEGNNLACLRNLKNLCFTGIVPSATVLRRCLAECQSLELLLFPDYPTSDEDSIWDRSPKTRKVMGKNAEVKTVPEDRIVFLHNFYGPSQWLGDWHNGATGNHQDMFARGREIVEERQSLPVSSKIGLPMSHEINYLLRRSSLEGSPIVPEE